MTLGIVPGQLPGEPRMKRFRSSTGTRRIVRLAGVLVPAFAIVLLASEARADCTPDSATAAATAVTATCTGTTNNQAGGAPGSSAGSFGYGLGETGLTVNVTNGAAITGTDAGIALSDVTVINNAGASITGGLVGIFAVNGTAHVINSGSITGTATGISTQTDATVTNNAGAAITSAGIGVQALGGAANVINSGDIDGTLAGVFAATNATVTNNAGASIVSDGINGIAIQANGGFTNVTNSGSIAGTKAGILAATDATVTNNAGGAITGSLSGIQAHTGSANVINSGSITGTDSAVGIGVFANSNATVTNNAGASIAGGQVGVEAFTGTANVTNFGSITGTDSATGFGIVAGTNATVTNNAGATITGTFNGIFANAGGSSVFNAGTISGGVAAIQFSGTGNTLTLGPGSVIAGNVLGTGADTFQLGGSGAATFDVSQLSPVAQYQGFGIFNKVGSSVWTLTGTSTFGGPVNVNAGTLLVDGDITSASGLTVNAGGTLGGSGTVGDTTVNGGALAPGNNAIGTLTVQGSLAFTSAASYLVEVSAASADRTNATGAATLAGTVAVSSPSSSFRFKSDYTILTSTSLNGTRFDALATPVGIAGSLAYTAGTVLLNLTSALGQIAGLNTNQRAVGTVLDTVFNAQGSTAGGLGVIFAGNVPQNLTQASGELATDSQQTTFAAMNLFMGLLTDPFVAGRGDGPSKGSSASGYADEANAYAGKRKPNDALAAIYTKAPPFIPFEQRWSTWVAGYGGSQSTDGNAALGSNNTTSSVYGTAVGADYRISPFTIAGFALAGGGTNFSVAGSGSGHSDLFQASAFVRHTAGPAYISAALAYGWQDITTDRIVTIAGLDHLRAEFNANTWSGRLEGGYRFVVPTFGGLGITPYAAGQFTTFDLPAYAESVVAGAPIFALDYAAKSVTDSRSELGVRTDKSFAMQNGILTLRGRLAWAHDYNPDRSIGATFQSLPGASFVVNGAAQAADSALTTASLEMKWTNGWSVAAAFEGEFSDVTASYAGKGMVRYAW
jgi:uncharacterized protein with beta-barrel porin domain